MKRKYILLLPAMLLISCAGRYIRHSEPPEVAAEDEMTQESVVDTSFEETGLFTQFDSFRTQGALIPGLNQALVPQGMAYWPGGDYMIISNYSSDGAAGVLSMINMETGGLEKVLFLENADGRPHTGHLGGLAVSREHLWMASGRGIYFVRLETLGASADGGRIRISGIIETETKASFATFSDGVLWVGEFTRGDGSYPARRTHHVTARDNKAHRGWLGGYILDTETDLPDPANMLSLRLAPDFILSIPDEIQGAVFFDEKVVLSASFGRNNNSRLLLFSSPLAEDPHRLHEISADRDVQFWFLDDLNKVGEIIIPPMSEALVVYEDRLAVLFESAASKYRATASHPLDRLQYIDLGLFNE